MCKHFLVLREIFTCTERVQTVCSSVKGKLPAESDSLMNAKTPTHLIKRYNLIQASVTFYIIHACYITLEGVCATFQYDEPALTS